jgi:hypothetical protein
MADRKATLAQIRLTAVKQRAYQRAAQARGMTLSQWIRHAADRELEALAEEKARRRRRERALALEGSLPPTEAERLMGSVREGRSRDPWKDET